MIFDFRHDKISTHFWCFPDEFENDSFRLEFATLPTGFVQSLFVFELM